jgi:4-aminobutyrate aminotransferase-like enzyme
MDAPDPRLAASHALWERARRVMPGGVYGHQNGAALGDGYPRFLARAERARVWDVDGHEYVDWMCAHARGHRARVQDGGGRGRVYLRARRRIEMEWAGHT